MNAFAPGPDKLLVAYLAGIRGSKLDLQGAKLVGGSAAVAFGAVQGDRQVDQLALIEGALVFLQRLVQLLEQRIDLGARRAGNECRARGDDLTLGRREEDEGQSAPGHETDRNHQRGQGRGDGGEAVVYGDRHQRAKEPVAKPLEALIQLGTQRVGLDLVRMNKGTAQMARQHQHTLHQRSENHRNDDQGNDVQNVADGPPDQHQGEKGRNGRQRGGHHRGQHPTNPALGRKQGILAHLMMRHGILADDDRVVHDDAQRHDERE
jgi:hypothetical protein